VGRGLTNNDPAQGLHTLISGPADGRAQHILTIGRRTRYTVCHQLFVTRHRHSMFGRRALSVAGSAACNSLPDYLRDPSRSADSFCRDLKTFSFLVLVVYTAHQRLCGYALYKSTIDTDTHTQTVRRTRMTHTDDSQQTGSGGFSVFAKCCSISRVVSVLDSGAEGPGFKSQSRRCRVTVLGKLFTRIVPLFTKQQNL